MVDKTKDEKKKDEKKTKGPKMVTVQFLRGYRGKLTGEHLYCKDAVVDVDSRIWAKMEAEGETGSPIAKKVTGKKKTTHNNPAAHALAQKKAIESLKPKKIYRLQTVQVEVEASA